jgi:hypothetical protein
LLIKLNELVVGDHAVIPIVARPLVAAPKHKLVAELSGWDNDTWELASWYLEGKGGRGRRLWLRHYSTSSNCGSRVGLGENVGRSKQLIR